VPCENFLYGFKAAPRAARAADSGRRIRAPAPLPRGWPLAPGRLARKAKAGPLKTGEVTEPRRICHGDPSRRLHRANAADLGRPPDRGQAYSRRPRVKSAAPFVRSRAPAVAPEQKKSAVICQGGVDGSGVSTDWGCL
jgi:hypothetical protein